MNYLPLLYMLALLGLKMKYSAIKSIPLQLMPWLLVWLYKVLFCWDNKRTSFLFQEYDDLLTRHQTVQATCHEQEKALAELGSHLSEYVHGCHHQNLRYAVFDTLRPGQYGILDMALSAAFYWITVMTFWLKFLWGLFPWVQWTYISIGLGYGLAPKWRQPVTWTNDVQVHWCHMASFTGGHLKNAYELLILRAHENSRRSLGHFLLV